MRIDVNGLVGVVEEAEMGVIELVIVVATTISVDRVEAVVINDVELVADGEKLLTEGCVTILSEVFGLEVIDADGIMAVEVFANLVDVTEVEDEVVSIDEALEVDAVAFDILVDPLGTGLLLEVISVVENNDTELDEFPKVVEEGNIERDVFMVPVEDADDFGAELMTLLGVVVEEVSELVDQYAEVLSVRSV